MPELFNANAGLSGRDGGPYLDDVQREATEKQRAVVENREPNLDNPLPGAETPLVTKAQLVEIAERSRTAPPTLDVTAAPVSVTEDVEDADGTEVEKTEDDGDGFSDLLK